METSLFTRRWREVILTAVVVLSISGYASAEPEGGAADDQRVREVTVVTYENATGWRLIEGEAVAVSDSSVRADKRQGVADKTDSLGQMARDSMLRILEPHAGPSLIIQNDDLLHILWQPGPDTPPPPDHAWALLIAKLDRLQASVKPVESEGVMQKRVVTQVAVSVLVVDVNVGNIIHKAPFSAEASRPVTEADLVAEAEAAVARRVDEHGVVDFGIPPTADLIAAVFDQLAAEMAADHKLMTELLDRPIGKEIDAEGDGPSDAGEEPEDEL